MYQTQLCWRHGREQTGPCPHGDFYLVVRGGFSEIKVSIQYDIRNWDILQRKREQGKVR